MGNPSYTREQIQQMPAGNEIEQLVAEHILGWRRHERFPDYWLDPQRKRRFYIPHYSRDIEPAWQVFECLRTERINQGGAIAFMGNQFGYSILTGFACDDVLAETMPLAICRAALIAELETVA